MSPEGWQAQPPVDHQTQAVLDGMPEVGAGQYFRGPDGKHRRVTTALREDRDIQQIRQRAFNDFAKTGVTWEQLAAYAPDQPHPGEDEAVALAQTKASTGTSDSPVERPDKMRDMGALPKNREAITEVTGDLGLGLSQLVDPWDGASVATTSPATVLVAGPYEAGSAAATAKGMISPSTVKTPKKPVLGLQGHRYFVESLVGRAANDNARPPFVGKAATPTKREVMTEQKQAPNSLKPTLSKDLPDEDVADAEYMNKLFNWQRQGKPAPAPEEYAIHVMADGDRFSYLEDIKDEWSRLVEANPEAILESMMDEVEKLSHAAQQDFVTAHHREANAAELTKINDAVEKVVFAPAEHWGSDAGGPNTEVIRSRI